MAQLIYYEKSNYRKKGKNMGIYQSIYASTKVLGPIAGSYIYFHFSGEAIWYLSALIGTFCFLSCVYYKDA